MSSEAKGSHTRLIFVADMLSKQEPNESTAQKIGSLQNSPSVKPSARGILNRIGNEIAFCVRQWVLVLSQD